VRSVEGVDSEMNASLPRREEISPSQLTNLFRSGRECLDIFVQLFDSFVVKVSSFCNLRLFVKLY
jgi:hypothetical protein